MNYPKIYVKPNIKNTSHTAPEDGVGYILNIPYFVEGNRKWMEKYQIEYLLFRGGDGFAGEIGLDVDNTSIYTTVVSYCCKFGLERPDNIRHLMDFNLDDVFDKDDNGDYKVNSDHGNVIRIEAVDYLHSQLIFKFNDKQYRWQA